MVIKGNDLSGSTTYGLNNLTTNAIDARYNFNFNVGDTQAVLTLGGKNLTDEEAPRVYDAANFSYDPKQPDPRGRIYYASVKFAIYVKSD